MPESLELDSQQAQGEGIVYEVPSGLYNGKSFSNKEDEVKFLQDLQAATKGKLEEEKWNIAHHQRLQELRNEKEPEPSQAQRDEFLELTRLQTKGGPEWTAELQGKIAKLYPLFNKN